MNSLHFVSLTVDGVERQRDDLVKAALEVAAGGGGCVAHTDAPPKTLIGNYLVVWRRCDVASVFVRAVVQLEMEKEREEDVTKGFRRRHTMAVGRLLERCSGGANQIPIVYI